MRSLISGNDLGYKDTLVKLSRFWPLEDGIGNAYCLDKFYI